MKYTNFITLIITISLILSIDHCYLIKIPSRFFFFELFLEEKKRENFLFLLFNVEKKNEKFSLNSLEIDSMTKTDLEKNLDSE